MKTFDSFINDIVLGAQKIGCQSGEESRLFTLLCERYWSAQGNDRDSFEDWFYEDSDATRYKTICADLYAWYQKTYIEQFKMKLGGRGSSREVTPRMTFHEENSAEPDVVLQYDFDAILSEKVFAKYAFGETMPPREIILHLAVAFALEPKQLNTILFQYGFLPLHVRDIHDLAVYSVLNDMALLDSDSRTGQNPFARVRTLYEQARDIVNSNDANAKVDIPEAETKAFADNSTRMIQAYLLQENTLGANNMLSYVSNHADAYTMRHRRLLKEHKKLVTLFSVLYDNQGLGGDNWDGDESKYSHYNFVNQYCKALEHRRYYDNIFGQIFKNRKNPTRELMITLWCYEYCFHYFPKVAVPKQFRGYQPFYRMMPSAETKAPFAEYVKDLPDDLYELQVDAYLEYGTEPTASAFFSGNDMVSYLQDKLQTPDGRSHISGYSWGLLTERRKFDYYITKILKNVTIELEDYKVKEIRAGAGKEPLQFDREMFPDNVPVPLAWIMTCLEHIKKTCAGELPLACDYYKQLI